MKKWNARLLTTTIGTALIASFVLSTPVTFGKQLTFTIDSTRSGLTLSLDSKPGVPITTAQFPGSDRTSLSGTQTVDITGNILTFISTANAQFGLQSTAVSPAVGGTYPGSAPGQYGLLASIPGLIGGPGPGGAGLIAVRGFVGDIRSGAIALSGSSFRADQVSLVLAGGQADANVTFPSGPFIGTDALSGFDANQLSGGTLTLSGNVYTLTLPIFASSSLTVGPATVLETYSGQVVATAVIPEPTTWILGALGVLALMVRRRIANRRTI
jgi:hypothetical protein